MLAHLPRQIGRTLSGVRPGPANAVNALYAADAPADIVLTSPAFTAGDSLPARYTGDGEGVSPPLEWANVPAGTRALLLVIEDVDSPTPKPLVHAIAELSERGLPEDALPSSASRGAGAKMGLNSYLRKAYMSPDPPPGHGPHRYVFQIFALRNPLGSGLIGRRKVAEALWDGVAAKGVLTAHYERL